MNKRQRKKRLNKLYCRAKLLSGAMIYWGRRNGKYLFVRKLHQAVYSNKYKPFKDIQMKLKGVMPID